MAKIVLSPPTVLVKDAQPKENIRWGDCILLLNVGSGHIQLGLYQQSTRYFIRLACYLLEGSLEGEELKDAMAHVLMENDILVSGCKETRLTFSTPLYTSVPSELYRQDLQDSYFSFLYRKEEDMTLQTDEVPSLGLRVIYATAPSFLSYIKNAFPHLSVFHQETVNLRQFSDIQGGLKQIILSLQPGYISVMAFSEKNPVLLQPYKAKIALDVIYYVLNVARQLEWRKEEVTLYLTGFHPEAGDIFDQLSHQLERVEWLQRTEGCLYPSAMDRYPSHYFYHLVSLALCGL